MDKVERHIRLGFILRDRFLMSLKLTTIRYWKRSLNCNIIASRIEYFLFKCYWYNTIDRGIRIDIHHGLVEINLKARLLNFDDIFVFAKQC
jgi:hypothetical protein